jgi:hypothetical protein
MNQVVMILVMAFPMILFTIAPGLYLADYLEKAKYVQEENKRYVMWVVTVAFALALSTALNLIDVGGLFK